MLGDVDVAIGVAEDYILALVADLLRLHRAQITAVAGSTHHVDALVAHHLVHGRRFPRITLADALALDTIKAHTDAWEFVIPDEPEQGRALTRAGERILIAHFGGPVWLTEMDHLSVPFYQAFAPDSEQKRALCADLLMGPGEVLGLGQRHASATPVEEALELHENPYETYRWYADIRDPGKGGKELATAGWGIGIERFLAWLLNHDDVRDFAVVPRLKHDRFLPWFSAATAEYR